MVRAARSVRPIIVFSPLFSPRLSEDWFCRERGDAVPALFLRVPSPPCSELVGCACEKRGFADLFCLRQLVYPLGTSLGSTSPVCFFFQHVRFSFRPYPFLFLLFRPSQLTPTASFFLSPFYFFCPPSSRAFFDTLLFGGFCSRFPAFLFLPPFP